MRRVFISPLRSFQFQVQTVITEEGPKVRLPGLYGTAAVLTPRMAGPFTFGHRLADELTRGMLIPAVGSLSKGQ